MNDLDGRVAVITGAAGGFGMAFASEAWKRGMRLVLADIEKEPLQRLEADLVAKGAQVLAQTCDVRLAGSLAALADAATERFGTVHLLINNAGVGSRGFVWESTDDDWNWVLDVNLKGPVQGIRAFLPKMLAQANRNPLYRGHVLNVASMAGLVNVPLLGPYNVSKHAVVSLSETLYHELRLCEAPIGVSVLCPHFVATGIGNSERNRPDMRSGADLTVSQQLAQQMLDKALTASTTTCEDIARLAFDGIQEEQFYVFSHGDVLETAATRFNDILSQGAPTDPYESLPSVQALMRCRLRHSWKTGEDKK